MGVKAIPQPPWSDKGTYLEPLDGENARAPRFEVDDATTYIDKDGSDNLTLTDAVTGTKTLAQLSGDVTGPASSVDNAIARFHLTTGKIIQDYTSGAPTINDTGLIFANSGVAVGTVGIGFGTSGMIRAYTADWMALNNSSGVLSYGLRMLNAYVENDITVDGNVDGRDVSADGTKLDALATQTINFIIDGGGSAITTGIKGDIVIDYGCTITGVTMLADQSGSIVVDIWKDSYANFPPIDGDSITSSTPPTITTATKSQDTTLTSWTTSITAGDTLRYNVDSITTCQRVTVSLKVTRT